MSDESVNQTDSLETLTVLDTGGCARYSAGAETCRWKCGSHCAYPAPNTTPGDTFEGVMSRYLSRRTLFMGAAAAGVTAVAARSLLGTRSAAAQTNGGGLGFT